MKKLILPLALATLVATCDRSPSDPGPAVDRVAVVVSPAPGSDAPSMGAVLLSVQGDVQGVESAAATVLIRSETGGMAVALSLDQAAARLELTLRMAAGSVPTVTVLQVADRENALHPDPTDFLVEIEGR